MGTMVYSLLWVMQDFDHQEYCRYLVLKVHIYGHDTTWSLRESRALRSKQPSLIKGDEITMENSPLYRAKSSLQAPSAVWFLVGNGEWVMGTIGDFQIIGIHSPIPY